MSRVEDALAAASETKALRIGKGLLKDVAELFLEQFPNQTAVIIADTTTYRIAGETVYKELQKANISH